MKMRPSQTLNNTIKQRKALQDAQMTTTDVSWGTLKSDAQDTLHNIPRAHECIIIIRIIRRRISLVAVCGTKIISPRLRTLNVWYLAWTGLTVI